MYFNNFEPLEAFGNWPKLLGDARECCYRFTTKSKADTHYVCYDGIMCVPWARMLIKKTKVYCVDTDIKHDEKD